MRKLFAVALPDWRPEMKALLLCVCLLGFSLPAFAQSADAASSNPQVQLPAALTAKLEAQHPASVDAAKYNDDPIELVANDGSYVVPLFPANGKAPVEFVSLLQLDEALKRGDKLLLYGDLVVFATAALKGQQTIDKLQAENAALHAENAKLWKVAMKDAPEQQPPTIVVQEPQQPIPQQPSRLEQYMLLRSLVPASRPYQLPMPVNPNANRIRTNCTANTVGNTTYTNCN